jgi:hypothetical protein
MTAIKIVPKSNCRNLDFEMIYCKYYDNEEYSEGVDDYLIERCTHPLAKCNQVGELLECPRIEEESMRYR